MQVPIFLGKQKRGVLEACQQGLYTKFNGTLQADGICRVYGVFSGGEVSLGIPVPEGDCFHVRAAYPSGRLPQGKLLCGKIVEESDGWQPFAGGTVGGVFYPKGERKGNALRFRWNVGDPLPADSVCCFYCYKETRGSTYLELQLGEDGKPIISE